MIDLPRITIVTPSFNQAGFLERTIRSVLSQDYPNLEYIIVDGGSTDGSVEIIRRYADRLTWWCSEPDKGQTNAINKGLRRATGEWVAWQNSDDIYYPGAIHDLARMIRRYPKAGLIIGDIMLVDENDRPLRDVRYVKPTYKALLAEGMVLTNQAAFWRRDLHEDIGLLREDLNYSFDYEWFLRLTQKSDAEHCNRIWGALRLHDETKTSTRADRFIEERRMILEGRQSGEWNRRMYRLRRLALMLGRGQISYILRGFSRHARGKGGELY